MLHACTQMLDTNFKQGQVQIQTGRNSVLVAATASPDSLCLSYV